MKILVTGANGYLGQGIVKALCQRNVSVVATDKVISNDLIDTETVECDLFSVSEPYEYFCEPDVLLHLAWRDGFVHYSDTHIDDLPKHYKFIEKCAKSKISRICVMGSMHEVGFFEGSIKESTPCNPITPYGISKNALRELTEMVCSQNNVVFQWLRGFYIVGNTAYGSSIFSKLVAAAQEGQKEFPFTQGQNQFDFIDYDDFCEQVVASILQDEVKGVINICSGHPEKLSDRVERFVRENNFDIKLKYGAFPDRPYDSKAIWGDDKKIEAILEKDT